MKSPVLINQSHLVGPAGNFQGLKGVIGPPQWRWFVVHISPPGMVVRLRHHQHCGPVGFDPGLNLLGEESGRENLYRRGIGGSDEGLCFQRQADFLA